MKSFKKPPPQFAMIFEGVLKLFGFFPKKNEKPVDFYTAVAKKQLDKPQLFLDKLKNIEKNNIPEKNIKSLNEF